MKLAARTWLAFLFLVTIPLAAQNNTPYAGVIPIPGTLQAENFDNGGPTVSWSDTSPGNLFGAVYRTTDVDVGQISATEYHVGAIETGEWVEYTVNVATAGTYTIVARYSSAYTGTTTFNMTLDGAAVFTANQSIVSTGSWSTYANRQFTGSLAQGQHILRINFVQGAWNPDWFQFTLNSSACAAPTISLANKREDAGKSFDWSASTSGATSYQWYREGVAIVNDGVYFKGATTSTLQMMSLEQGRHGGSYYVKATNSCGTGAPTTTTSNTATFRVPCSVADDDAGPDGMLENVYRALTNGPDYCEWDTLIDPNYPNNFGGGISYNIPVINAATAFIKEPYRSGVYGWNMDTWWQTYLARELGRDTASQWYFGGQEFGSYDYQKYNIASVLAVHYHATKIGKTTIKNLARDWLKASVTLLALAASADMPLTLHTQGLTHTPLQPYTGPYSVLAGERSPWGFWMEPDRNILMADAIRWTWSHNGAAERWPNRHVRELVEARWPAFVPPGCTTGCNLNAFGLTQGQTDALRYVITNHTLPSDLIANYLGSTIRTQNPYHIVAWSGVRATLLERSTHTSTAPTIGAAYFTAPKFASGREAHFLYPWDGVWRFDGNRLHRNGIVAAYGLLNLNQRYMQGWQNGSAKHQAMTLTISDLPPLPAKYWITLYPDHDPDVR